MKHTPGPWLLSHHNAPIADTGDYDLVTTIDGSDNHRVADWFNGSEVDEANAKLIAAAPELLSALKAVLPLVKHTDDNGWHQMKFARELVDKLTA